MTDKDVIKRSLLLMRSCILAVEKALPNTDPELIGGFFADLLDLWETGQQLDRELKKLKKFRFPRDREKLYDVLIWIDAIQVDMASYWIGEVKKDGRKLRRALDKLERGEGTKGRREKPMSRQRGKRITDARSKSPEVALRPAQKVELEKRLKTLDRNRASAVTWKQLRAELARRRGST
jgi:hypothetical protein